MPVLTGEERVLLLCHRCGSSRIHLRIYCNPNKAVRRTGGRRIYYQAGFEGEIGISSRVRCGKCGHEALPMAVIDCGSGKWMRSGDPDEVLFASVREVIRAWRRHEHVSRRRFMHRYEPNNIHYEGCSRRTASFLEADPPCVRCEEPFSAHQSQTTSLGNDDGVDDDTFDVVEFDVVERPPSPGLVRLREYPPVDHESRPTDYFLAVELEDRSVTDYEARVRWQRLPQAEQSLSRLLRFREFREPAPQGVGQPRPVVLNEILSGTDTPENEEA